MILFSPRKVRNAAGLNQATIGRVFRLPGVRSAAKNVAPFFRGRGAEPICWGNANFMRGRVIFAMGVEFSVTEARSRTYCGDARLLRS